jgi:thiol-disulfide isomerase/thioredoxin
MRSRILLGVVLLGIIGAGLYYYITLRIPEGSETFTETYELELQSLAGETVELSDFRREMLVTHVWASWCPYCAEELRNLARLKSEYGDRIQIVAVNRAEPEADAKRFLKEQGIEDGSVTLLLDGEDAFFKEIGGYAMPETLFTDKRGVVCFHQRGPLSYDDLVLNVAACMES